MNIFSAYITRYSNLPVASLFTEFLAPLETESGQIIQKESFND